ncbi:hypothetical protein Esti_004547 [Eimeria stiedai]
MDCVVAVPGKTRVGWIGTGVMGKAIRTASKASSTLQQQGAHLAGSPHEVAERSDILCLIVGTPDDVKEVLFGENGAAEALREGSCVVDFTTSDPALAEEVYVHLKAKGVYALDCPVSGGDVGAASSSLCLMVGGDLQAFEALNSLFEALGKRVTHVGGPGAGQRTKLANQITLCTNLVGLAEGLLFAERAGLDLGVTLAVLSGGAASSWSVEAYGPRVLAGDFKPGFSVQHFLKDLRLALSEAARLKLALPGVGLALQLYQALEAQGGGALGVHALKLALHTVNSQSDRVQQAAAALQ